MSARKSVSKSVLLAWVALACGGLGAATINFLATEDNDLANTANWSASTWTSADTLFIATDNFTMPADGLRVSTDMPVSAEIKFGKMPAANVTVDFGGYALNTTTLRIGNMHPKDAERFFYIKATGGFTGVTNFYVDQMKGHIRFYDGVYRITNTFYIYNWFPYVYICDGAQVIIEKVIKDYATGASSGGLACVFMSHDAIYPMFVLDGGRFTILEHGADYNWTRVAWLGRVSDPLAQGQMQLLNGSVYEDVSVSPADKFGNTELLIKDSYYFATNGNNNARNTEFCGDAHVKSSKTITNSVFRTAQIYCGPYSSFGKTDGFGYLRCGTVDFCDSEVTLAYRPGSDATLAAKAGMVLPNGTSNNTIRIRGTKNRFTTQQFVLGGRSNTVEVAGGTFAVSNVLTVLASSDRPHLSVSNTTAYVKQLAVSADATNSLIAIGHGANVTGYGQYSVAGRGGALRVEGGAVLGIGDNKLRLGADGATLYEDAATVTGSVAFAANNGRVVLSGGTSHKAKLGTGWAWLSPLWFSEGMTNNVLVISNATYDCGSYFMKEYITTVEGVKQDAVPFTNCPNCRIEFRGTTPKFVVSNAKIVEGQGQPWYGLALGEMIDHAQNSWTNAYYRLKDPLRVRYVLPTEGYAEAPLQCLSSLMVLGGNAEFEFDMSQFTWPKNTMTIPLAYDKAKFTGGNYRKYINVKQLNQTNADTLPVNPLGRKSYLKLSDDGKTLNLVIKGQGGLILIYN